MNEGTIVGISGNIGETKTSSSTFADGKPRNPVNGQFGKLKSVEKLSSPKPFIRYESDLSFGEYHFGSVKLDVSWSNFAFSVGKRSQDLTVSTINKPIAELSKDMGLFSPELVAGLKNSLSYINCDIDKIIVKEVAIEGSGAALGMSLSQSGVGARANAQVGALRILLDTPAGEITVKLKRGLGIGAELGRTYTKDGRPGTRKEKKVSLGSWEVSLSERQVAAANSTIDSDRLSEQISTFLAPQIRAQNFVKQQEKKEPGPAASKNARPKTSPSATQPKLPRQSINQEQTALLDQTVEEMASHFKNDGEVVRLYETYQKNGNRAAGFATFQHGLGEHLQREERANEWVAVGTSASVFLSQVATLTHNKDLGRFATGIGALTQAFSGMRELSNVSKLISASSSGVSAATLATGLLGGAGLVLGGFAAFASFMDDDDDELGEALAEIHSAVTGMWTEMRESFQATWQMLEVIDQKLDVIDSKLNTINKQLHVVNEKLDVMEANNQKRFFALSDQINAVHRSLINNLNQKFYHQEVQINHLKITITSYLDYLVDSPLKTILTTIRKSTTDEILNKLKKYSTELAKWLLDAASMPARTRELLTLNNQLQIDQAMLINMLQEALAPENFASMNLPFGLFKSLAASSLGASVQNLKLVNPQNWFAVLDIYLALMTIARGTILQKDEEIQQVYWDELNEVAQVAQDMSYFFDLILGSKTFWQNLMQGYQKQFTDLNQMIEKTQIIKFIFEFIYNYNSQSLHLDELAINNYYNAPGSNRKKVQWSLLDKTATNLPAFFGQNFLQRDVSTEIFGFIRRSVLEDIKAILNGNALSTHPLFQNPPLIASQEYHTRKGLVQWNNMRHLQTFNLLEDLNDQQLESLQNNLNNMRLEHAYEVYLHNDGRWLTNDKTPKCNALDRALLDPIRKMIVHKLLKADANNETARQFQLINGLRQNYLTFILFIKVIDPDFDLKLNPDAIQNLEQALSQVKVTSSASDLKAVYEVTRGIERKFPHGVLRSAVWQEELWSYMGDNLTEFTVDDLVERLRERLPENPLRQKLQQAISRISEVQQMLDPRLNREVLQRKIDTVGSQVEAQQVLLEEVTHNIGRSLKTLFDLTEDAYLQTQLQILSQFSNMDDFGEEADGKQKALISAVSNLNTYEDNLRRLCSSFDTSIKEVEAELIRLEEQNKDNLEAALNSGNPVMRPLYLAIVAGRKDIVVLLLEHGAKIDPALLTNSVFSKDIRALLHFHYYIEQQSLEEGFDMSKTIGLIKGAIDGLAPYQNLEHAILFIGKTGAGKSSLVNSLLGVEYELDADDDGQTYLKTTGEIHEPTRTSALLRSETSHPQILNLDHNAYLVDMPGFRDTRGLPWNIAGGLSAEMLSYSLKSVRALVLVCTDSDLYDARIEGIRDSLEMLGRLVDGQEELMPNILLVINKAQPIRMRKGSEGILNRIKTIKEDKDLSSKAKFVLERLTKSQIILTDVPDHNLKEQIMAQVMQNTSIAFDRFNFTCYHKEAEKFKTLLARLAAYRNQTGQKMQNLVAAIASLEQDMLRQQQETLASSNFTFEFATVIGPRDLSERQAYLKQRLIEQQQLQSELLERLSALEQYIEQYASGSDLAINSDTTEKALDKRARLDVVNAFFMKIKIIIDHLKLKDIISENDSFKPKVNIQKGSYPFQSAHQKQLFNQLMLEASRWEEMILEAALQESLLESGSNTKQALITEAAQYGFRCVDVKPDGNCFFHAVLHQFQQINLPELKSLTVAEIKGRALNYILDHLEHYSAFMDESSERFIDKLLKGEWADNIYIHATAKAFDITIAIVEGNGSSPKIINKGSTTAMLYLGHEILAGANQSIGLHYQSLIKDSQLNTQRRIETVIEQASEDNFLSLKDDKKETGTVPIPVPHLPFLQAANNHHKAKESAASSEAGGK